MKLPNWFKVIWWILLVLALGLLVSKRFGAISSGTATPIDAFLLLIWFAVLLLPLFKEFDFFGIKLKAEFEGLRSDIKDQVNTLRTEIHSTINSQISTQFHLNPPPDSQLSEIEDKFRKILNEVMHSQGIRNAADLESIVTLPAGVDYLFAVRYAIEREVQRIYVERVESTPSTPGRQPILGMAQILNAVGLLDQGLLHVLREVYSICTPAIHGEPVSDEKLKFVKGIAPNLIMTLMAVK